MSLLGLRTRIPQVACALLLVAGQAEQASALNCQSDVDCGAPAVCELTPHQTCQGEDPACPAGSACGAKPATPDQTNCATYLEGICRSPWELPCAQDADCGTGFRCVEQIHGWCRGGASVVDGGISSSWMECGQSRGTFACELVQTPCDSDAECAAGLRCQESSEAEHCARSPLGVDGGTAGSCPATPTKLCAPPSYFPARSEPRKADDTGSVSESAAPVPAIAEPGAGSHGDASTAGDGANTTFVDDEATTRHDDGCALVSKPADRALWLGVLGTGLLFRRRGRRSR